MGDRPSRESRQELGYRQDTGKGRGNGGRGDFAANVHRQHYEEQPQITRLAGSQITPEQLANPNTRIFGYPIYSTGRKPHPNDARHKDATSNERQARTGPAFGIGYRNSQERANEDISVPKGDTTTESLSEGYTRRSQSPDQMSEASSEDSAHIDEMTDINISSGSSTENISCTNYFDPIQDTIQRNQEGATTSRADIPSGTFSAFGSAVREATIEANIKPPKPETALPESVRETLQQLEESPNERQNRASSSSERAETFRVPSIKTEGPLEKPKKKDWHTQEKKDKGKQVEKTEITIIHEHPESSALSPESIVLNDWKPKTEAVQGRHGGEIWGKELIQAKESDMDMSKKGIYFRYRGTNIVQYIPKLDEGIKETKYVTQALEMMKKVDPDINYRNLQKCIHKAFNTEHDRENASDWDIIKINK